MKFKNLKWLASLALLQFLLNVNGQVIVSTTTTAPPVVTTITTTPPPVATTTTTTPPPPVTTTTTTLSTLAPVTSVVPVTNTTTVAPTTTTTTTTTTTVATSSSFTSLSSTLTVTTSSSIISSPTPTQIQDKPKDNTNNTAIIVGCVVGGVVGIALIGGIIACINRRGGCTKKRDRNKSEFEDYGLGDFPHHRPTVVAAPMAAKPVSPTIPRLNDQGNYYADDGYGGHYGGGYVDNNMEYGMQQPQGYYYPDQQQQYYDDGGYYYDSNTSGTAYSTVHMQQHSPAMHSAGVIPMQQQQQPYINNNIPHQPQQNIYKPDEVVAPVDNGNTVNVPHNR